MIKKIYSHEIMILTASFLYRIYKEIPILFNFFFITLFIEYCVDKVHSIESRIAFIMRNFLLIAFLLSSNASKKWDLSENKSRYKYVLLACFILSNVEYLLKIHKAIIYWNQC